MDIIDFKNWLEDLNLQTLTDELKSEIFTQVEILVIDYRDIVYQEGIDEGKERAKEKLQEFLDYDFND